MKSFLNKEDGITLTTILLLISVLTILGVTISHISVSQFQNSVNEENRLSAYYIAKSGANIVAGAIENSIIDPMDLVNKVSSPTNLNNGNFVVRVTENANKFIINSEGTVKNITQNVILELSQVGAFPPLDHAIFADGNINLQGGPVVTGDIGTNQSNEGSIRIDGNPKIEGDLYVGPDGSSDTVETPDWYKLEGEIHNLQEEQEFPLPEYPEFPTYLPYFSETFTAGWWPSPPYYINNSIWYDKIEVQSELIINIYDEDLIIRADEFIVSGSGKVTINKHGSGKLKLFVSEKFELNGSGTVNNNGDPDDVFMYYSGDHTLNPSGNTKFFGSVYVEKADIEITGSGGIIGNIISGGDTVRISGDASALVRTLYAPSADIIFTGSGKAKGAVLGNNVHMQGGSSVEYDKSIEDIDPEDLGFEKQGFQRIWK